VKRDSDCPAQLFPSIISYAEKKTVCVSHSATSLIILLSLSLSFHCKEKVSRSSRLSVFKREQLARLFYPLIHSHSLSVLCFSLLHFSWKHREERWQEIWRSRQKGQARKPSILLLRITAITCFSLVGQEDLLQHHSRRRRRRWQVFFPIDYKLNTTTIQFSTTKHNYLPCRSPTIPSLHPSSMRYNSIHPLILYRVLHTEKK